MLGRTTSPPPAHGRSPLPIHHAHTHTHTHTQTPHSHHLVEAQAPPRKWLLQPRDWYWVLLIFFTSLGVVLFAHHASTKIEIYMGTKRFIETHIQAKGIKSSSDYCPEYTPLIRQALQDYHTHLLLQTNQDQDKNTHTQISKRLIPHTKNQRRHFPPRNWRPPRAHPLQVREGHHAKGQP